MDQTTRPEVLTAGDRRRRHERKLLFWVLDALLVLTVAVVLVVILGRDTRPAKDAFLDGFRDDHPGLSQSDAPDGRLLDAALSECTPEGMSASDARWLRQLGVDLDSFREDAQDLCPSR